MAFALPGRCCVCCGSAVCVFVQAFPLPVECPSLSPAFTPVGYALPLVRASMCVLVLASPVVHLCRRCSDYFVVMGFGLPGADGKIANALNTVTCKNPIAGNCVCMYKVPMTLPAHLLEVSPTNPLNYCMTALDKKPVGGRAFHHTRGVILWAL